METFYRDYRLTVGIGNQAVIYSATDNYFI